MATGGAGRTRIAETSVPAMTQVTRRGRLDLHFVRDLDWSDELPAAWGSVALFGGLCLLTGIYLGWGSSPGHHLDPVYQLVPLALVLFFVAAPVSASVNRFYVVAILGAAALLVGLGVSMYSDPGAANPTDIRAVLEGVGVCLIGVGVGMAVFEWFRLEPE